MVPRESTPQYRHLKWLYCELIDLAAAEKALAAAEAAQAGAQADLSAAWAEIATLQQKLAAAAQSLAEVEGLHRERDAVRQRVERMLATLDDLV